MTHIHAMNMDDLWLDMLRITIHTGNHIESRDGDCTEITGTSWNLICAENNVILNPRRKFSPWYACAELIWYLSGEDDISRIVAYAPQYARFAKDGIANGAYGKRINNNDGLLTGLTECDYKDERDQIELIIELLKRKPDSRQAVIQLWSPRDLPHAIIGDTDDLPCTLSLQFLRRQRGRKEELHMITTMRSQDVWLGVPYDFFCFTSIQRLVADALEIDTGYYTHNVGSLHIYDRDLEKCKEALKVEPFPYPDIQPWNPCMRFDYEAKRVMNEVGMFEKWVCDGHHDKAWMLTQMKPALRTPSLLSDAVITCGVKWGVFEVFDIHNDLLRRAADAYSGGD